MARVVASHAAVGLLPKLLGGGRFGEIVAGSVYLPLNVFEQLGAPVFQPSSFFLPPPTFLGWFIVCAFGFSSTGASQLAIAWVILKQRHVA